MSRERWVAAGLCAVLAWACGGARRDSDAGPGPWPTDAVKHYTADYALGQVQSVGVDDAYNLWLLQGERIGVLRPGDAEPTWTSRVGQAAEGFGPEKRATGSTVICGGTAGRAYVGYRTYDLSDPFYVGPDGKDFYGNPAPHDPSKLEEFKKGDLDVVRLEEDGSVSLEVHLGESVGPGPDDLGIHNTNDWRFDEDRSVLVCTKVMRGRDRGELYIGTNHGVTRIRGTQYNAHRHPVWYQDPANERGLRIGYSHALGISQEGDVLIGNEWKIALLTPLADLASWDRGDQTKWRLDTHVDAVGSLEEMDEWRDFEQATSGDYFLASQSKGLWKMTLSPQRADPFKLEPTYARVPRVGSAVNALAATDDGSLFIGGSRLLRLPAGALEPEPVEGVPSGAVRQLLYDPTVKPAMLYVLLQNGDLHVLRGD